MNIVTREEARTALGQASGDANDATADQITRISNRLAIYTGRRDWGASTTSRTDYRSGGTRFLYLDYWPIVTITSIHDDDDHVFDSATLEDATNYYAQPGEDGKGIVYLETGAWTDGIANVKVVYTAGYATIADIPEQIKTACLLQLKYEVGKLKAGSFVKPGQAQTDLLPEVRDILGPYTRRFAAV